MFKLNNEKNEKNETGFTYDENDFKYVCITITCINTKESGMFTLPFREFENFKTITSKLTLGIEKAVNDNFIEDKVKLIVLHDDEFSPEKCLNSLINHGGFNVSPQDIGHSYVDILTGSNYEFLLYAATYVSANEIEDKYMLYQFGNNP